MISEQTKQIAKMRLAGLNYDQIARKLDISNHCVSQSCVRQGVAYKDLRDFPPRRPRKTVMQKVSLKSIFENELDAVSAEWLRRAIA